MGSVVTAPLYAVGACLGSCCAAGCCKLAFAGSVDSSKGARCLLLWLQICAAATSLGFVLGSPTWLDKPCAELNDWVGTLGVCECYTAAAGNTGVRGCLSDQMVFRSGASVMLIYLFMLLLCISGCARGAAKYLPVLKFMAYFLMVVAFWFVPNSIFSGFGYAATLLAAGFAVAQAILLIDFAMTWNDMWFRMESAWRPGGVSMWKWGLLVLSLVFFIVSIVLFVHLLTSFPEGQWRAVPITAFVVSVLLLGLSITEWCEVGTLIGSSGITLFCQWLSWQVLAGVNKQMVDVPVWLNLAIGAFSLFALATFGGGWHKDATPSAVAIELAAPGRRSGDSSTSRDEESGSGGSGASDGTEVDTWDFSFQCLVHCFAAAFITAVLAPLTGTGPTIARTVALALSLFVYLWVLVAPKVLTGRSFR